MTEARNVVLIKSKLLSYSTICYIGIVPDAPCPHQHRDAHTPKRSRQCSVILAATHGCSNDNSVPVDKRSRLDKRKTHPISKFLPGSKPFAPYMRSKSCFHHPETNKWRKDSLIITNDVLRLATSKFSTSKHRISATRSTSFVTVYVWRHHMSFRSRKRGYALNCLSLVACS